MSDPAASRPQASPRSITVQISREVLRLECPYRVCSPEPAAARAVAAVVVEAPSACVEIASGDRP